MRPGKEEAHEFYFRYINLVAGDHFLPSLTKGRKTIQDLIQGLSPEQGDYAYAPGKWTLKEALIHLIDTERIMAYRALCAARGDQTPQPGFEQDDYIPAARAAGRSLDAIASEYLAVRDATLELFKNLDSDALATIGIANGSPITARAIGFIIAGHELHHLQVIRDRYLGE